MDIFQIQTVKYKSALQKMLLGHRGFSVPNDWIQSTKSRCIILLKIKSIKKKKEKKKQSKTSKIVELYCTKSSICTFSGIQSGVQWLIQMFSIRSWVGVFLFVLSFLSCSECELRLFPPSCEAPAALRSLYTTRAETRLLIGCFSFVVPASGVSSRSMTLLPGTRSKQDEAYRRGGKLKSRYTKIPQVHIRTACYLSTRRFKRVARLEQHRVLFSNFTGTPRPLQQPLCPSNPDTILWVRIGYIVCCWVTPANWYRPAHIWISRRTGSSLTGAGSLSHPGAPPAPRDVGGGGGAPLPSFSPAGRERMERWRKKSWAWCPQKMHETQ